MHTENNKTILVVDDVPAIRSLFCRYLKMDGYDAVEAESGEQALGLAADTAFAGILLDLQLPGMDGIQTCRQLRALDKHEITPILVITSTDNTATLSEAFAAGCDDYIIKPINQVVLRARLATHIQRAELYNERARMRELLNRYISPKTLSVIERYLKSGESPGPEQREICVLNTDIRGFTQLAQRTCLDELFKLLSEHLARQAELVYQYGGYIDKYAGDGITAIFEDDDMAQRGCLCAQGIIAHAQDLIVQKQNHLFAVSCGLSKGPAVFGDIGSSEHLNYTVVGSTVNLAARLCSNAWPNSIIVSAGVHAAIQHDSRFLFLPREDITVTGYEESTGVYELTPVLQPRAERN